MRESKNKEELNLLRIKIWEFRRLQKWKLFIDHKLLRYKKEQISSSQSNPKLY